MLSGTVCSVQLRPWSAEIMTALVSSLPVQAPEAGVLQRKTGSSHSPPSSTTIGWRMKMPEPSCWSKSVSIGPQLLPSSVEMRRRTIAVSWWPEIWAVQSSHSLPSGTGNKSGFCSDRVGSSESRTGSDQCLAPGARREK